MKIESVAVQLYTLRDYLQTPADMKTTLKRIIAAAEKGGTKWFAVEQDACPGYPFESIRQSFDYIAEPLVEG